MQKQTLANKPKNLFIKAIEQVKISKNAVNNKAKSIINRSNSLRDSHANIKTLVDINNSISNLNVITESANENEIFLGNDSQSTLSNRTSIDDMNDDYTTSNKYDTGGGGAGGGGGYKSDTNFNEAKAYRMMNIKFSDTYKDIVSEIIILHLFNSLVRRRKNPEGNYHFLRIRPHGYKSEKRGTNDVYFSSKYK